MKGAVHGLAGFVAGLSFEDLPREVVAAAKLHALDTLGCGLAARALGEADWVIAATAEAGSCGPATGIGMLKGLPVADAALVNGTLCHALDFDDTHPASVVHVSAATVPAALAVAQGQGRAGREMICALVAGNETSIRLGMAAGGRFHARGFHPTGVCGVFGATATAARLAGLDADQTANALGVAASMAGGLLEFLADGSQTKPLHPGWAAHAGIVAARLAAHGATGPGSILEGRRGFFGAYLHGEPTTIEDQLADLGVRWETPNIAFKPYPACHYIHAPLDSLAILMANHQVSADDIASIVAFSDTTGVALVLHPLEHKVAPRTSYDAKFSLPYCLGAQLVHGRVDVSSFTAEAIVDARTLDIARCVTYETKAYAQAPDAFPGGVRVTTVDGRVLEGELRHQRGDAANPMSYDEIIAKYRANAGLALPEAMIADLEAATLTLDVQESVHALAVLAEAGSPK